MVRQFDDAEERWTLMPYLDEASLNAIGDLRLRGSDMSDDDLKHVTHMDLRSIDLSKTNITGEASPSFPFHLRRSARAGLQNADALMIRR